MDLKCWFISFGIKKFIKFDDVMDIIEQLDEKICGNDKIYLTNFVVYISKSRSPCHDYICKVSKNCDKNKIINYLTYRFIQAQNQIKFYNTEYGFDWYVDWRIVN